MIGQRGGAPCVVLAILAIAAPPRAPVAVAKDPPAPIQVVRRADASLRGRVLDETGKPVAGAEVRAARSKFEDGPPQHPIYSGDESSAGWRGVVGRAQTDPHGAFEIGRLETDVYSLDIQVEGAGSVSFGGGVAAPGGGPACEYVLPAQGTTVDGDVRDVGGSAVPGAIVVASVRAGESGSWSSASADCRTDATGRFHAVGLPRTSGGDSSGGISLTAESADRSRWAENAMRLKPGRRPLLWLAGPAEVLGTVVDQAGAPVAHARVAVRLIGGHKPSLGDLGTPADLDGGNDVWMRATTTTDDRGAYRFERLPEGLVSNVTVAAPGIGCAIVDRGPARTVNRHGVGAGSDDGLYWLSRAAPARIDVVLRRGRTVQGVVLDAVGSPMSGVRMALCDRGTWLFVAATTGDDGSYRLFGMPWEKPRSAGEIEGILLVDASGWDVAGGTDVTVLMPRGSGPTYRKELRLAPVLAITGRVLDAAGAPASGAWVTTERTDGQSPRWTTCTVRSGTDGAFLLPNLLPGQYRLTASHAAVNGTAKTLLAAPAGTTVLSGVEIRFKTAVPPAPDGK